MADFKLSKNSKKNIKGVRKSILVLIDRVLKKSPHDFGIPEYGGKRTAQQQNNLFHRKPKVTWLDGFKRVSYHQSGNAFDIFIYDEHDACWDCLDKYKELADLFKTEFELMKKEQYEGNQEECWFDDREQLYWGGDWRRLKDRPHFEIR